MDLPISSDLARAVRRVFKRYAVKGINPHADAHGIECLVGTGEYGGTILFRIVTEDYLQIGLNVNIKDLLDDPRAYLENMERDIQRAIDIKREERQRKESPLVLGMSQAMALKPGNIQVQ